MKHGTITITTQVEYNGDSVDIEATAANGEYTVTIYASHAELNGSALQQLVRVLADMHTRMEKEISKEDGQ